jgi:thioredoxin 1
MVDLIKSLFGKKEMVATVDGAAPDSGVEARTAPPPRSNASPVHVTDDTFEDVVLNADVPAMVDFWAPWCGPCRMVAPIVEDLAKEYGGRAVIAKVNTDENVKIASNLGIMGIPTLILFKGGEEVGRVVGFAPRQTLEGHLQALLGES